MQPGLYFLSPFFVIFAVVKYVDVILPLPLDGLFTYAVCGDMEARVAVGMRLLVPVGKAKSYVGVAARLHDEAPAFEVKAVMGVLDDRPVLLPEQLKLWQWMADYYMAQPGEVYRAALPAGLKAEDGWRPRTETYVGLHRAFRSRQALGVAWNMLSRAKAQQNVLEWLLKLTGADASAGGEQALTEGKEVTREELMNASGCRAQHLKALLDRGILYAVQRPVGRINSPVGEANEPLKPLTAAQSAAYEGVLKGLEDKGITLLHGVTSSGKTELYIHLIAKTLARGKQVLYLLPEIALTVQITARLKRVFGSRLGIYHSKYSDDERVEIWRQMLSDNAFGVILGARSSVFLPYRNLGLVIIDEEHETSYKQQDPAPRYHARAVGIMLARHCGAHVLLGTATPSLETYRNVELGKYALVELKTRYKGVSLPEIEVVDVKDLRHRKLMSGPFSPNLLAEIRQALARGKQAIVFQNRRGFAPSVECKDCGWTPKCHNCDVTLTYHKRLDRLVCHYCGSTYRLPATCPNCESTELRGMGYGTEKIEDVIRALFPAARVARMDLDTTRTRNAYGRIIGEFSQGKTDILIGTQMVSKGLDFDNVAVVGILDADSMLNYPDFRAYEHAYTMMAQVAGRAGRRGKRGKVVLQTRDPALPLIRHVVENDYASFYKEQLSERQTFLYPPFCRLTYIYIRSAKEAVAERASEELGGLLRHWFGARVLGPDKPSVARARGMSLRKIMLKTENGLDRAKVRHYLRLAERQLAANKTYSSVQVFYDVDPV